MSTRSLSLYMVVLVCSTAATVLAVEPAGNAVVYDQPATCNNQTCQPPNYAPACAPVEKPAPVATWWANSSLGRFYYSFCRDTKRNNCWPEPFIRADRLAVREPFITMVANGWRRQNTLGTEHFEPETGKLNRAGQLKIRRILLEGLPQHHDLYVYRSERPSETAQRVDSVQQYAAATVRDGAMPPIYETDIPSIGWPAQRVDVVDQKYQASMPTPTLPTQQNMDNEQ